MITVTTTITRGYHGAIFDFEVETDWAYLPGARGLREPGTGLALSPDDPPELDLVAARNAATGEPIELYPAEEEEAEEKAWERLREEKQAAPDRAFRSNVANVTR